jgi:hypothetical protein
MRKSVRPWNYGLLKCWSMHRFALLVVFVAADGETVHAGAVEVTAHFTPGHTPLSRREAGDPNALVDKDACRRYAAGGRDHLRERLAREQGDSARP